MGENAWVGRRGEVMINESISHVNTKINKRYQLGTEGAAKSRRDQGAKRWDPKAAEQGRNHGFTIGIPRMMETDDGAKKCLLTKPKIAPTISLRVEESKGSSIMIRRIHIKGYKSLRDVELELKPLSVLFGPNAAGKSNFLDVLQLLSTLPVSRTLKEAFNPPYRGKPLESFSFGDEGIQGILRKDSASFSIEADVELSSSTIEAVNKQIREMRRPKETDENSIAKDAPPVREQFLRYRIEIEILPKSGILRVVDEYLAALNKAGQPTKSRMPFLEMKDNRLHLRMEGQAHPIYHEKYLDHSILSTPLYPPHYPHIVAMRQELAGGLFFYFEPRERMRMANPVKEVRHIGPMGEDLASFLNTLKAMDELQFRAIVKALHQIIPSINDIQVEPNSLGEVELTLLEGKTPIPARVVSEGSLRILGLLALGGAKEPPTLLGFEEPENGVHPRRIRLIAEFFNVRARSGMTQLIVTTHSPILPDLIPDNALFVCRKVAGRTEIIPFECWGPLFRSSETEKSLDDGDEHITVSERILRGDFDA